MRLLLSPVNDPRILNITKTNDTLTINGESFDFSQLLEGATLPKEAVDCEFIISDVSRINGEIELTILLPHGANASHEARFPEPINMTSNGRVMLPI